MPELNLAITRTVSPAIARCELTFIERAPIDYDLAVVQHEQYCVTLRACGVEVIILAADSRYPDCAFVEDTALVFDEAAIITNMGTPARRGEAEVVERALASYRPIVKMQPPATLDGGDVLRLGRTVYVGISARTNDAGVSALRQFLTPHGYHIQPVRVTDCLHLKSACTAIDDETILANPQWADMDPFSQVRVVPVPDEEPRAAEVMRVNDTVVMHVGFPRTRERVESLGASVRTVDLSEFLKAEAGPTCLSLLLSRPEQNR